MWALLFNLVIDTQLSLAEKLECCVWSTGMGTIRFKPSLLGIPFDGGLVLADGETERLYVYNASAGLIWTSLSDGISIADCAALISESRRMELPVITAHINSMVSEWRRLGILYGADTSNLQTDPVPPPQPGQNTHWQSDYVNR